MPKTSNRLVKTDKDVKNARAYHNRTEYRVKGAPNLVLRVGANGSKSWSWHYRLMHEKKWRSLSLGDASIITIAQAKDDALKLTLALRDGKDPRRQARGQSFRALAAEFLADRRRMCSVKWCGEISRMLKADINPMIGDIGADVVSRDDIVRVLDRIKKRGSYRSADQTLTVIRAIYGWAAANGLLDADPTRRLRKCNPYVSRNRVLSDDEIKKLWWRLDTGKMSPAIRDALRLCLLLAVRLGEAINAAKSEFDLVGRTWTIPAVRVKNRHTHTLPLSDVAIEIIQGAIERSGDSRWLFPSPSPLRDGPIRINSASYAVLRIQHDWDESCDKTTRFTCHDLRRTVATRLGKMGLHDDDIGRVLNHTPTTITGRVYNHATRFDAIRDALDAWAHELQHIVGLKVDAEPVQSPLNCGAPAAPQDDRRTAA